tara:strand:+ start:384 stop:1169 length:786 start_codon:yes stop_codon:yes gene_type:complete
MKVIIITSIENGIASSCVRELVLNPNIEVLGVIHSRLSIKKNRRYYAKKIKKIIKIGILGVLNGIRIRKWFFKVEKTSIYTVCSANKIPLFEIGTVNSFETEELLDNLNPDLGVSLGNNYINKKIFSIPKYGIINVHTEILPEYQGAHGVIWPIYYGKLITGFTIHTIDEYIDTGDILYIENIPIIFQSRLKKTVETTMSKVYSRVPNALSIVCGNFLDYKNNSIPQKRGIPYTTPTISQFIRMCGNNYKLHKKSKMAKQK